MKYKMLISYDGTRYSGWQRLKTAGSIQGKIEDVLSAHFGHKITIDGAGRTDAGVHAKMQAASFEAEGSDADKIKAYLRRYLPDDICVYEVSPCDMRFHARFSAKEKIYEYTIVCENKDPFLRKYSMFTETRPDVSAMKKAASFFIGTHDFTAFSNAKSKKKSTVRTVSDIDITEIGNVIKIHIRADGFLYNMARKMTGALIECGLHIIPPETVDESLKTAKRSLVNTLAPAQGLCLKEIIY